MDELIKAIDNNDTSILYSCDVDASIREYVLKNKNRIVDDIFSLKLVLDDVLIQKVYSDIDFVKASILAGNIDVASNFEVEEMHRFLTVNIDKILDLMLKKVYVLSSNTPRMLVGNENFIKICLDNGFIQIIDYAPDFKKYYYENKAFIDSKCLELISKGIICVDKFSSKLIKNKTEFLLASIKMGNFDCLLFTDDIVVNKYLVDNYRFVKNEFYSYIRKNNYFIDCDLNIKLPAVKMLYSSCLKRDIFSEKIKKDLFINTGYKLKWFVSFMDVDTISYLFGPKILKIYSMLGLDVFDVGYENLQKIKNCSNTAFERLVKLFDPNVKIKMENVRNLYFLINKEKFLKTALLSKETGKYICEKICADGVFSDEVTSAIDLIKKIIDISYLDYLSDLVTSNNLNICVKNKTSREIINEIFEYYRRLSIISDENKMNLVQNVICQLCEIASMHEFDVYMSSKMNFADGYPFMVEPSDIYLRRVFREQKLLNIKNYIVSNKKNFDYFCEKTYVNFKDVDYKKFKSDVKKYLTSGESVLGLGKYLDSVLSRISKNDFTNVSDVDYNNLPLLDEYLKASVDKNTIIEVFKNLDFDRLLYFLDDNIFYENIKSILFDKQFLYLIDCFKNINGFYNVKSLVNLINNFDVLTDFDDELMMFEIVEKNIRLPLTFSFLFDNVDVLNKSDVLIKMADRMLNILNKEKLAVPFLEEKIDDYRVCVGGFDIDDVTLALSFKNENLCDFIAGDERGFVIKIYRDDLVGIVYGVRYGNTILLSNLDSKLDGDILQVLNSFLLKLISLMKQYGDRVSRIYLSREDALFDRDFSMCLKNIGLKLNNMENADILYSDGDKIKNYISVFYKLPDIIYEDKFTRGNKINILRLVKARDIEKLIDYSYIEVDKVGRTWYSFGNDQILE